jgi:hypothetical protein
MAFAVAVGDYCSPFVYSIFAANPVPPILGIVTSITPTVVAWQDGTQTTYTPSTGPTAPDAGLSKVSPTFNAAFVNHKVQPNGTLPVPNLDGRANAICVQTVLVINAITPPLGIEYAIVRFDNGLYVAVPTSLLQAIPGA